MNIIETRLRDVPWEDIIHCATTPVLRRMTAQRWERDYRGKPIRIFVPAIPRPKAANCATGPFYRCVPDRRGAGFVCPHMAEIGD